jgi:hypothetical protein
MPGTFTHFIVVEQALDRYRERHGNGNPLVITLEDQFPFALQGSIGPDYPFVAERLPIAPARGKWGARMHFENTGAMVDLGLRGLSLREREDQRRCTAWLFGFASHLVADTIIHPVVNLAVGGIAQFTEEDHGTCELTQDCWLFHHLKAHEIADCGYVDNLARCSDPRDGHKIHPAIRSFWSESLKAAHPSAPKSELDAMDPDHWHEALLKLVPWAANPTPFSRHMGALAKLENRLYRRSVDLDPNHVERFVTRLRIPNGAGGTTHGSFLAAFNGVVDKVADLWEDLENRLALPVAQGTALPNWDLDSGVEVPSWDFDRPVDLNRLALWGAVGEDVA